MLSATLPPAVSAALVRSVTFAPAGAKVTLRAKAADAAGGSVAESITSAYQIAG